ncbi:MAG TPA: von Willebrand factor type A domain-containing protein, partial [Verrucomicrobiae bacterium]|nr:von Willebrand factor type A domain-containing protein [Verrucomicrobiae bacterium]
MKIDPNDPRLTAYALGELDAAERAEIEAWLKGDEAARREIETIRRAAGVLTEELKAEPCPELTPAQVAEIEQRFDPAAKTEIDFPWWRLIGWATAVGAAALMVALFLPALSATRNRAQRLALHTPSEQSAPVQQPPPPKLPLSQNQVESERNVVALQPSSPSPTPEAAPPLTRARETGIEAGIPPVQERTIISSGSAAAPSSYGERYYRLAAQSAAPAPGDLSTKSAGNLALNDGRNEWDQSASRRRRVRSQPESSGDEITIYRGTQSWTPPVPFDTESYPRLVENAFISVSQSPLSTFGLDVDTASYANIRRFLNQGSLPPRDAVRIEEMLNYFSYNYPAPKRNEPFSLYVEMAGCPWNPAHRLALIGLKARDVAPRKVQPMNLVFLIDVSGSMQPENKLPLIKQALRLLVEQLTARDHVAIVVYADNSRVVLPSTRGDDKEAILAAIDSLEAGGSTNGGAGIQSAYREATGNFIEGGVNRVILCTDGDFNVGITDQNDLVRLIQQQAKTGVFLSVLGFGMGNLKDSTMQKLADKGNGNYAYVDDLEEAQKVLVDQMRSTLVTVAKDVKLQIEFNPALVQSYRLIGYEKRMLRARDFNNDRKDAGEVGAGHTTTALYEIIPASESSPELHVEPLRYQPSPRAASNEELMTVKLRYKEPEGSTSKLLTASVKDTDASWRGTSSDFRFAASVAA